jgi:hypothetical protein
MWWHIPVISALRRLRQRQEDLKFEASQGYIVRPCLKNKKKTSNNKTWSVITPCHPNHSAFLVAKGVSPNVGSTVPMRKAGKRPLSPLPAI